jgi:hypothetical protein
MDIASVASDSRVALDELLATAEMAGASWTIPRAPGKWSPQQVTEHVARTFDEAANLVGGRPAKFPSMPFFVRPIFRGVFFNKAVRTGVFPSAKTFKAFNPESGPDDPAAARERLVAAHQKYQDECAACAASDGTVNSSVFGAVSVADYMRFTTMHTRHHQKQIPTA